MTPAATTPAAREGKQATAPGAPGQRRAVRRPAVSTSPRRVSGPAGGRAGVAQPVVPRPARPERSTAPRRVAPRRPAVHAPLGARALAYIRALPDHRLLDRLIRGRAWIPLLGVLLVGIVAMQVEVLKLGASMGRSIERGTTLQSTNELLRENVAALADDQRIEKLAAARGMVMPAPAAVGFLSAHSGRDVQRAVANIHAPSAQSFLALATANGAVAAALTTSTAITLTASSASSASTATSSASSTSTPSATVPTGPSSTISAGTASATSPNVPTAASNLPGATGAAVANLPSGTASSASTIPATPAAASGNSASGQ